MSLDMGYFFQSSYETEVFNDDCISLMEKIPGNSIDLIFADPPYNTTNHDQIISVSTQLLNQGGYFILESSPKEFSILPSRIKQYGDTQLAFWRYEE